MIQPQQLGLKISAGAMKDIQLLRCSLTITREMSLCGLLIIG